MLQKITAAEFKGIVKPWLIQLSLVWAIQQNTLELAHWGEQGIPTCILKQNLHYFPDSSKIIFSRDY